MDLAGLRKHLDEDEAAARAVAPLGFTTDMGANRLDEKFSHGRRRFASEDGRSRIESDPAAERHFARNEPGVALRRTAACRAILAAWQDNESERTPGEACTYTDGLADGLGLAVQYLAAIYSDDPAVS